MYGTGPPPLSAAGADGLLGTRARRLHAARQAALRQPRRAGSTVCGRSLVAVLAFSRCAASVCCARRPPSFFISPPPAPSAPAGIRMAPQGAPGRLAVLPPNPQRGFAVGRPPRAPAEDGLRSLRGAAIPDFCPPPTRRRPRPRAPAQSGLRSLRAGPSPHLPPRGRPGGRAARPGGEKSIAAGRASSGQGQALRCAPGGLRPALTAPALPRRRSLPPGRNMAGEPQALAHALQWDRGLAPGSHG